MAVSPRLAAQARISDPGASVPDIAYGSGSDQWLVVWRERNPAGGRLSRIMGQRLESNPPLGRTLGDPFQIGGYGEAVSKPRVAYSGIVDGWLVVWASRSAIEGGEIEVRVRRVQSDGSLPFSARRLAESPDDVLNPAVAAGWKQPLCAGRPCGEQTPFFLVVWEQVEGTRRGIWGLNVVFNDATDTGLHPELDGFGRETNPLPLDDELPPHDSFHPRLSRHHPVRGVLTERRHRPRLVFEVRENGQRDIYSAAVDGQNSYNLRRVTTTPASDEMFPVVDWNPQSGRSLVLFERPAVPQVLGRHISGEDLLGPEFPVADGESPYIESSHRDDGFAASVADDGSLGLGRIYGQRIECCPADGFGAGSDQPAFAISSVAAYITWRFPEDGDTLIRGFELSVETEENSAPTADAGADLEVTEGATFQLDGSASSDPDGDPLLYRWSQTGDGDAFLSGTEKEQERPRLEAPRLEPPFDPSTLEFQLEVDDLRSEPRFPSSDTVQVTVVPGNDPNPPTADAGPDRTADEDTVVELQGSGSDPDGEDVSFVWEVESVTPPVASVELSQSDTASPAFRTPRFAGPEGLDVVLRLRVVSTRGASDEDTVTVHVNDTVNEPPLAEASAPAEVQEGEPITLDAGASSDPNGDELSFEWELASDLFRSGDAEETLSFSDADAALAEATASVFDDRDLTFRVTVDDGRGETAAAEVTVRVTGIPLEVDSFTPESGSPGTRVIIRGSGLLSPETRVYFRVVEAGGGASPGDEFRANVVGLQDDLIVAEAPNGPARLNDVRSSKLGSLVTTEYPAIERARIVVTRGDEEVVLNSPLFDMNHHRITDVILTQGVSSYELVRRKDTLLQVRLHAVSSPPAGGSLPGLTDAVCTVLPSEGDNAEVGGTTPSNVLSPGIHASRMDDAVNFFIDGEALDAPRFRFDARIFHNSQQVARVRSTVDSPAFVEVPSPRILVVRVVPHNAAGEPDFIEAPYQQNLDAAMDTFRRITPFPDTEYVLWPDHEKFGFLLNDNDEIKLRQFNLETLLRDVRVYNELADRLTKWNTMNPDRAADFVVAFIHRDLMASGSGSGLAVAPRDMMARIARFYIKQLLNTGPSPVGDIVDLVVGLAGAVRCGLTFGLNCQDPVELFVDTVLDVLDRLGVDVSSRTSLVFGTSSSGATLVQEIGHNLGYVDVTQLNHDSGNISHSRYDEDDGLDFFQAPDVRGQVFDVTPPGAIYEESGLLAKSVMSYAPGQTNSNTFFEPRDYNSIVRTSESRLIDGGGGGGGIARGRGAGGEPDDRPRLRLLGAILLEANEAMVQEVRPVASTVPASGLDDASPIRLVFLDSAGTPLDDRGIGFHLHLPFDVHPPAGGERPDEHPELVEAAAAFTVTCPLPEGTASVQLEYQGRILWSRQVSPSPPSVEFTSDVVLGDDALDRDHLRIAWTGDDPDGDPLTYSVAYSPDGGETFRPLAVGVDALGWDWSPSLAPAGDNAVLRVTASDGFHTAEAVSSPFSVPERPPIVAIVAPGDGESVPAGATLGLCGRAQVLDQGPVTEETAYAWSSSRDGDLGSGRELVVRGLSAGQHDIRLEVTVEGRTGAADVTLDVLPDRDGDGISDAQEEADPVLDPDDPGDASRDTDGDGLSDAAEVQVFGTDPADADADGDGVPNGDEVAQGQSPSRSDTDDDGVDDPADNCPKRPNPEQRDANGDGIGDVCPVSWTIAFRAGPNLVHLPLDEGAGTAFRVLELLGGPERVREVSRWDPEAQAFETVSFDADGLVQGTDFPVASTDALRVVAETDFELERDGALPCAPLELVDGRNLTAFPCVPAGTTAFSFLESRGPELGANEIRRQLPGKPGTFRTAALEDGEATGDDFVLRRGEGYWVITGEGDGPDGVFRRGDANDSGAVDLSDAQYTLNWLFTGGPAPACPDAADPNDDGDLDLTDAVYTLNWLFIGGPPPVAPGPGSCGPDPTEEDGLGACASTACE